MTKNELRKWVRERKRQFSREELDRFSLEVSRQVLAHESWLQASLVLLYNSLPDEVDTHLLIQSALEAGKQVLLPVVVGDELELRLYSSQMRQGAFGILEPEGDAFLDFAAIDLAIVPGMIMLFPLGRKGDVPGRHQEAILHFFTIQLPGANVAVLQGAQ